MRRKSERTATKKTKASPEKKVEKTKRTRTRRRKSTSSENESEENSPVRETEPVEEPVKEAPTTPVKEDSPEDAPDQVWQVKTADASNDAGEIKKLKICLTRPPSTPERVDRSPRSKRKHSRATSSSDTPSSEGLDERKRSRRSRKNRESKDESDKNDNQGDEGNEITKVDEGEIRQSTEQVEETPESTTNEDGKNEDGKNESDTLGKVSNEENVQQNKSDADTTVASPKQDAQVNEPVSSVKESRRSESVEKSEVLELHVEAEDSKIDSSESQLTKAEEHLADTSRDRDRESVREEVSINQDKSDLSVSMEEKSAETSITTNKTDVVESSVNIKHKKKSRTLSADSEKERDPDESTQRYRSKNVESECSDSMHESKQISQDETIQNGPAPTPIVINRKRKWGSRPKFTTQKSITISTDVLKEIIPDVKPVEFEEVIEEKKHRRIEVVEKVERPVLPKIIIDNTENVDRDHDGTDNKDMKKETNLSVNRRISIVKDNDSIIARPPSPPRYKPSNILYITNLVRPFTLPQLKNLLQRTGRIVENGFWIDRIKSKCFVQYENEDQAVETRHALHGVTWPVSNPKALQVDFSTQEAFEKARLNEENDTTPISTIPGTVEDWLREQDLKRERGELEKPWERKAAMREWDVGKGDKDKEGGAGGAGGAGVRRGDERAGAAQDKRRRRSQERSPEPARRFKKKEEEAPAKLLDDLFRKTKATPCIYWLPLSAETIAIKEEQRRKHMEEHERRMQELRRHRSERDRRH